MQDKEKYICKNCKKKETVVYRMKETKKWLCHECYILSENEKS